LGGNGSSQLNILRGVLFPSTVKPVRTECQTAKQLTINAITEPFPTQKAALEFFQALKDKREIGTPLVDTDAVYVNAVYEQYCSVTNWPIPDEIVAFSVDNKAEEISPGEFRTQKCFWYRLRDGTKLDFSIIKAIQKNSRARTP